MNSDDLIQKYSLKNSKFMDLYGINVHYCDEGRGEVILLLHGVFSSLHTFNKWTEILSQSYRVIRLDLPGFGLTGNYGSVVVLYVPTGILFILSLIHI